MYNVCNKRSMVLRHRYGLISGDRNEWLVLYVYSRMCIYWYMYVVVYVCSGIYIDSSVCM